MATEVKIPNVGESVSEVTLASWIVEDGAYVEMDDPICELETDKASQELFAETSGVIKHVAEEGDDLEIGALVATIDESAEGSSDKEQKSEEAKEEQPEEDKSGKEEKQSKESDKEESDSAEKESESQKESYAKGHASPAAQKILAEKGIEASAVKGTGKDGRITKEDAENAEAAKADSDSKKEKPESSKDSASSSTKELSGDRAENRQKMSRLRQTIAKRLVEVKNQTAMLTTFNEVDMSAVMDLRKKYKEVFKEKHEVGLGFMSFFAKAAALAAKEYPSVNGKVDGNEIITYNYCDVGIAVSTERGLVVPVIRDVQNLGMAGIEKEVINYAKKARDNKISIDDMQGGTFSITNGGVFGSMLSTPIINGDQSAILGMHNIVQRPVAVEGEVKIRPVMYLALSYDHRIVDGKESVSFLKRIKEYIEDPARLLLEV